MSGGTLFVVATPIGNLGDVTLRSLEVLQDVPLIAAEDTRITARLLVRHEIHTRMVSYHARNADARGPELLAHLRGGSDLALVTDAGTPAISDPGSELVAAWGAEGGRVVPVPGASAVLASIAGSGIAGPRWTFEGFLPRSGRERRDRLGRIATDERGAVLFEAPGRVGATLSDLAEACGRERPGAVARELTKVHEEIVRGSLGELAERVRSGEIQRRGEFVIVVGHGEPVAKTAPIDTLRAAQARVEELVAGGVARGEAARRAAAETGIARRRLYDGGRSGSIR